MRSTASYWNMSTKFANTCDDFFIELCSSLQLQETAATDKNFTVNLCIIYNSDGKNSISRN